MNKRMNSITIDVQKLSKHMHIINPASAIN